jgi:uncharacterized repeat protein (TIGR01451 family)
MHFTQFLVKTFLLFCTTLCLTQKLSAQVPGTYCHANSVSAYYTFENTWADRSGNGRNAQNSATNRPNLITTDAYRGNYSASFNGSSQFVRYNNGNFMNNSFTYMSVLFWIKPNTLTGIQTLFEEGGAGNGVCIRLNENTLEAAIREDNIQVTLTHQLSPVTGSWQSIALTYDNGEVKLYLNGVEDTDPDGATGFAALNSHTDNSAFGATNDQDAFGTNVGSNRTFFYNGLMDDIGYYWDTALSQSDITDIMACQEIPFQCNSDVYISQNEGSDLKKVDFSTNPYTFIDIDTDSEIHYNGGGFNEQDNFMYGMVMSVLSKNTMVRISADGTLTDLGPISGVSSNNNFAAGDIAPNGTYYFMDVNSETILHAVDLSAGAPYTVNKITLSGTISTSDLAYNTADGLLYGIGRGSGKLLIINPSTGNVSSVTTNPSLPTGIAYGAVWFNALGEFYAYRNTGTIYRVETATGNNFATSSGPVVEYNDGMACSLASPLIDASVTINTPIAPEPPMPGDSYQFEVVLQNNGPALASDIIFEKELPADLLFQSALLEDAFGQPLPPSSYSLNTPLSGTGGMVTLLLYNLSLGAANAIHLKINASIAQSGQVSSQICAHFVSANQTEFNPNNNTACASLSQVLPVELSFFRGKLEQKQVLLQWETESEIDNLGFEVEMASDDLRFRKIHFEPGAGNSTEQNYYEYLVSEKLSENVYFRLKQVDFDGAYSYSDIIHFNFDQQIPELELWPNPAQNQLNIRLSGTTSAQYELIHPSGQIAKRGLIEVGYADQLSIAGLMAGIYIFRCTSQNHTISRMLVIN